jgi:hypothetical protein
MKFLPCAAAALVSLASHAAEPPEPAVQRQVNEDDNVRIEELKVRGQTQRIVVQSKLLKGQQYEIVPISPARDPSVAGHTNGQRVWHLFAF